MDNVFFYQSSMELSFRSPDPWHSKWVSFNIGVDLYRVSTFLQSLDGQVGVYVQTSNSDAILQFEKVSDKEKFEMHSKLSDWERVVDFTASSLDHLYPHIVSKKFLLSSILNVTDSEMEDPTKDDQP